MVMSTRISADATRLIEATVLEDEISIFAAGAPVTVGFTVSKPLTLRTAGVAALVQTITLENAVESLTSSTYSVKVPRGQDLAAGDVVEVTRCALEPSLVGKRLLVDKVSQNGAALLRKAVASDWTVVNQEGKGAL